MPNESVCQFHKYGHCKFSVFCKHQHISEICQKYDCEKRVCQLRHPALCKYFTTYGNCKFGEYCSFEHTKKDDDNHNSVEIETLREEIIVLKQKVKDLEIVLIDSGTETNKQLTNILR